jgi:hypothetical protein
MSSKARLGAVSPFDRLRSPVVFVVIDIGPFRLGSPTVFLNARSHMDSVLLLQFFICQMLRWRRLHGFKTRKLEGDCSRQKGQAMPYVYSYSRPDLDQVHLRLPYLHLFPTLKESHEGCWSSWPPSAVERSVMARPTV